MISIKMYFIATTFATVVNGKTIDKIETLRPTSTTEYSECRSMIKNSVNRYKEDRKRHRKNKDKNYTYKTITCKSKSIKNQDLLSISNYIKF